MDALSHHWMDHAEWSLSPHLFQEIASRYSLLTVDLFASASNHLLPRYFSRYWDTGVEAIDALHSPWPSDLQYGFSPFPLISRVLRKLLEDTAELILLARWWPKRHWYADLVSLSVADPWSILDDKIVLKQGALWHPDSSWYHLIAWRLTSIS